jgi:hypothetical protein
LGFEISLELGAWDLELCGSDIDDVAFPNLPFKRLTE